jgi:lipid-binding SYLF domain-containing protein
MKTFLAPFAATLLLLSLASPTPLRAGGAECATVESAAEVVQAFSAIPFWGIPPALLCDAAGVAILPHVVKAGFLVGGRYGRGVVLARRPDGTWGDPVFVTLAGGGFGLQAGIQSTDVVLVFKTSHALDRILQGGGKLTLGGDVAIAAGPVGRQAEAATDGQLRAEIYSYSRSRGLFAGVSLEGAGLLPDAEANAAFYATRGAAEASAVECLKGQLNRLAPPPPILLPAQTPPPPLAPPIPAREYR